MNKNGTTQMKGREKSRQTRQPDLHNGGGFLGLPFWVWLAFIGFIGGGGTLATYELFIWNKVPPELVGTWDVEGGPLSGGTFDFSRSGNLEMRFKKQGKEITLKGRVLVKDKTLFTTTRDPIAGKEETNISTIRELTAHTLTIELESGDVLKMGRWK